MVASRCVCESVRACAFMYGVVVHVCVCKRQSNIGKKNLHICKRHICIRCGC